MVLKVKKDTGKQVLKAKKRRGKQDILHPRAPAQGVKVFIFYFKLTPNWGAINTMTIK